MQTSREGIEIKLVMLDFSLVDKAMNISLNIKVKVMLWMTIAKLRRQELRFHCAHARYLATFVNIKTIEHHCISNIDFKFTRRIAAISQTTFSNAFS